MYQKTMNLFSQSSSNLFFICGPCVMESRSFALETAQELKAIFAEAQIPFVYKSSFDKANRSSGSSFRGLGLESGLSILEEVSNTLGIPVLTDVHETWQVKPVAEVVDVLQIPAFLSRQTDLIVEAAKTGKYVNFKKGQFLSPWDMQNVLTKARKSALENGFSEDLFFACERGTTFGYNNLVVDMRGLQIMKEVCKCPIIFDATHSLQLPGGLNTSSGGQSQYVPHLARAAVATASVSGIFMEAHPHPSDAPCDGLNMISFSELPKLVQQLKGIRDLVISER